MRLAVPPLKATRRYLRIVKVEVQVIDAMGGFEVYSHDEVIMLISG